MSRNGSTSRLSSLSSYRSAEPRIPMSCNLLTWQRLQSLARANKAIEERLQGYKNDMEDENTVAPLAEAYNLEAEIQNLRVLNEQKSKKIELLRRMCIKKRMDIAKLNQGREQKAAKVEQLRLRRIQTGDVIVRIQENLQLKQKYLNLYTALIRQRTRYMLTELRNIFKIELRDVGRKDCSCRRIDTICGAHLPPINALAGHSDVEQTAAFGYLVHLLELISKILDYPLRYPLDPGASNSHINCPREDKRLPFFGSRWKADKERLDAAVTCLGRNVAQLRADTGLQSPELNKILQSMREWMEVVIHGRGQVTYVHRPWLQIGSPALLMDSLDDAIIRPFRNDHLQLFEPLRTSSALENDEVPLADDCCGSVEGVDLDVSVISSLCFEESQRED